MNTADQPGTGPALRRLPLKVAINLGRTFRDLEHEFDQHNNVMISAPLQPHTVLAIRDALGRAGQALPCVFDLGTASIEATPWLFMATSFVMPPLMFRSYELPNGMRGSGEPMTIEQLASLLVRDRDVLAERRPRVMSEDDVPMFLYAHAFLEAVSGWLGTMCRPRVRLELATCTVDLVKTIVRPGAPAESLRRLALVLDSCPTSSIEGQITFPRIGRAAAAACHHVAGVLDEGAAISPSASPRTEDEQDHLIREVQELTIEVQLGGDSVGQDPAPAAPPAVGVADDRETADAMQAAFASIAQPVGDPIARWYELRPDWGRPRGEDGPRPVELNWRTQESIQTAAMMVVVIEGLVPLARAANPDYVLPLHELAQNLRSGLFATTNGRAPTIEQLARVDLIVADLAAIKKEREGQPATATNKEKEHHGMPKGTPSVSGVNSLLRDGKTWRLAFEGEERTLLDLVGFSHLQKLLASPNSPIDVHDLKGVRRATESYQPAMDGPAAAAAKREYDDAKHRLEEAEENNDEAAIEKGKQKLQALAAAVGDATQRSARRNLPSDAERVRGAVGQALRKALDEIKSVHPRAHAHLTDALDSPTGTSPCYRPASPTIWQVNLTASVDGSESSTNDVP